VAGGNAPYRARLSLAFCLFIYLFSFLCYACIACVFVVLEFVLDFILVVAFHTRPWSFIFETHVNPPSRLVQSSAACISTMAKTVSETGHVRRCILLTPANKHIAISAAQTLLLLGSALCFTGSCRNQNICYRYLPVFLGMSMVLFGANRRP